MTLDQLNIKPDQLDELLRMAAKKLGTTPENLRAQIESGQFDSLLQSPQAQTFLKRLAKKK